MKRQVMVLLMAAIMLLPGCSKATAQIEKVPLSESEQISFPGTSVVEEIPEETPPEPFPFREVKEKPVIPGEIAAEPEAADVIAVSLEPENIKTSKQSETAKQIPLQTEQSRETEQENSSFREVKPPADKDPQEETIPVESLLEGSTEPESKPEPEQSEVTPEGPKETSENESEAEPEKESEPDFDIGYWLSFAKDLAESKGLVLNPEATECWDNPITANSGCIYLERDLNSRLNRYAKDENITDVWIWYEDLGNQQYLIFIGYA